MRSARGIRLLGAGVAPDGGQLVFYSVALAVTVLGAGLLVGMHAADLGGTYRFAAASFALGGFVLGILVSILARILGWLPTKRRIRDLVSSQASAEVVAAWHSGSQVRAIVLEPGLVMLWGRDGDKPLAIYGHGDALEVLADGRAITFANSDSHVRAWPRRFVLGEYVPMAPPQVELLAGAIRDALAEPQPKLSQPKAG